MTAPDVSPQARLSRKLPLSTGGANIPTFATTAMARRKATKIYSPLLKAFGVTADEIQALLDYGCSEEEIEEMLYDPALLHEMTGELLYAY